MVAGALDTILIPSLRLEEILSDGSTLSNPAADSRRLFLGEDGYLHLRDSAGNITDPIAPSSGNVATDPIWDAAGDIAVGTGANTAAKLASGAAGTVLTGAGVGVAPTWAAGGITTDTYGTDSDGGTSDTATGRRMAAKKITITTAGRLVSIGGYILGNATQAGSLSAMLLDNNGGVPGKVIAMGDAVEGGSILLSTTVRAIDIPVSAVVTATDYWIAIFWYNNTGSTLLRYVASGSDYTQAATGTWALDNGVGTGYANSSRTYSIRASVIR